MNNKIKLKIFGAHSASLCVACADLKALDDKIKYSPNTKHP